MGNKHIYESETLTGEHAKLSSYKLVYDYRLKKSNMQVDLPLRSQSMYQLWELQLARLREIKQEVLLLPIRYEASSSIMCGTAGVLKIEYECYPYVLHQEINNRRNLNTNFSEQQLWYLLYCLAQSSLVFQNLNIKSGDVRPRNILLNSEGQIKLVHRYSFPEEITNYQKSLEDKVATYLAPEQLDYLEKGIVKPDFDESVAESFSIGLSIVDAGLLIDCEYLYDMRLLTFRNSIYKEHLRKWRESSYSVFLKKTVENMLEINQNQRPTPGEIHALIEPYRDQILNLQTFVADKQVSSQNLEKYQQRLRQSSSYCQKPIKQLGGLTGKSLSWGEIPLNNLTYLQYKNGS